MGCCQSKGAAVRTLSDEEEPLPASAYSSRGVAHAWLQEIGLAQYARAFEDAGFSDWDLLSCLTESDLDAITQHTGAVIPPGHRKKLLMASRQMGQASQYGPGAVVPLGVARRYSHSSNPGTSSRRSGHGSRGGGLVAAAANVLERRSAGRRPSSSASRVPSHHGTSGHPNLFSPGDRDRAGGGGAGARYHTDDGMASGRRSRILGNLLASRNSSRNSLSGGMTGGGGGGGGAVAGVIGYIASPSATDKGRPRSAAVVGMNGGGGGEDVWGLIDGRPSPGDQHSPHSAAAAAVAASAAAGGMGTPQSRQRRRWSVNKQASRGALVVGSSGGAMSAGSMGWMDGAEGGHGLGPAGGGYAVNPLSHVDPSCAVGVYAGPHSGPGESVDYLRELSVTSAAGALAPLPVPAVGLHNGVNGGGRYGSGADAASPGVGSPVPVSVSMAAQGGRGMQRNLDSLVVGAADLGARGGRYSRLHAPGGGGGGGGFSGGLGPCGGPAGAGRGVSLAATPPSYGGGAAAGGGGGSYQGPAKVTRAATGDGASGSARRVPSGNRAGEGAGAGGGGGGTHSAAASRPHSPGGKFTDIWRSPANAAAAAAAGSSPAQRGPSPLQAAASEALQGLQAGVTSSSPAAAFGNADSTLSAWAGAGGGGGGGGFAAAGRRSPERPARQDLAPTPPGRVWGVRGGDTPSSTAVLPPSQPDGAAAGAGGGGKGLPRFVRAIAGWASPSGGAEEAAVGRRGSSPRAAAAAAGGSPAKSREGSAHRPNTGGGGSGGSGAADASTAKGSLLQRRTSQRSALQPDTSPPRGPWDQDSALCVAGRGYRPASPSPGPASSGTATGAASCGSGEPLPAVPGAGAAGGGGGRGGRSRGGAGAAVLGAVRNGGWPFVLPTLPRISGSGSLAGVPGVSAAAPGSSADPLPVPPLPPGTAPSPFSRLSPLPELGPLTSASTQRISIPQSAAAGGGGDGGGADARVSSSLLLESVSDAAHAPPVHSSRPPGFKPRFSSAGGNSETAGATLNGGVAEGGGGGNGGTNGIDDAGFVEDLLTGPSFPAVHPRGQAAPAAGHSAPPLPAPYDPVAAAAHGGGGGRGAAGAGAGSAGGAASAVAHWPAMPLQPPTRPRAGHVSVGHPGAAGAAAGMQVLTPEAPGPTRQPQRPAAMSAATVKAPSGPPRPTPGRQLDLELLADQVQRIMAQLSAITATSGAGSKRVSAGGEAAGAPAGVARAGAGAGGAGAVAAAVDAMDVDAVAVDAAANPAIVMAAAAAAAKADGIRMQAMDRKRLELQLLHRDLVSRVAAMAALPSPRRAASAATLSAAAREDDALADAEAAEAAVAAGAVAEVEARIRAKLAELAELTGSGGQSDTKDDGGVAAAARKRAAMMAAAAAGETPTRQQHLQGRVENEAALHDEVLAVLGARKRQARAGRRSNGGEGTAATAAAAATAACEGASGNGFHAGSVLAGNHDTLRDELLAIEGRIKARVREAGGGAVARRQ